MLLWYATAYLLGSVPFGLFAGLINKIDIRHHGSKNIGATNVFRVIGKKWGILVLVLDAAKGYVACNLPVWLTQQTVSTEQMLLLALFAVLGHTFPVWLKFKGGKGVATSLGVFLAVAWQPTLSAFGFWIIIFSTFRIISVASLAAGIAFPILVYFFENDRPGFIYLFILSVILMFFMFYTHRANIVRLKRGEEKKLF